MGSETYVSLRNYKKNQIRIYLRIPPYLEHCINPVALRKAKIVYNFGLSECNRVQ